MSIHLAVEDTLGERLARCILSHSRRSYCVCTCFMKQGKAYLERQINAFNHAAQHMPFFVLTDLDMAECAPSLVRQWLPVHKHPNLLFRVAVTEAESWIMADRNGLAEFLGISVAAIPPQPDTVRNAKEVLVALARKSTKRDVRNALVPASGSTAQVGPDYNAQLGGFIERMWRVKEAEQRSPSLRKAIQALDRFSPVLGPTHGQEHDKN